ncbi:four-carbon acid sugar kinase family protein [Streptomyces sp. NPDC048845]|uniref:four-carbon acid sugar kinase family protein n=1 Tax=Streptomyces sp. NPDC048845 TaxID=3155390 RepID=UPI00341E43C7
MRGAGAGPGPRLGCIADDFTGATDLAGNLVRAGHRTILTVGPPDGGVADEGADAVVVALKTRTAPRAEAVAEALAAHRGLAGLGCTRFWFKYCSTFDSTPEGNIGPVTDALLDATGAPWTVACPAFPDNGRTVYQGHLFVGDRPLHETGMRHHPLTPMTDPDLVRVLAAQTRHRVGLLPHQVLRAGDAAVRARLDRLTAAGTRVVVTDVLGNEDFAPLLRATAHLPLLTGGSGLALALPPPRSGADGAYGFDRAGGAGRTGGSDGTGGVGGAGRTGGIGRAGGAGGADGDLRGDGVGAGTKVDAAATATTAAAAADGTYAVGAGRGSVARTYAAGAGGDSAGAERAGRIEVAAGPGAVLAGSVSDTTLAQTAYAREALPHRKLPVAVLLADPARTVAEAVAWARSKAGPRPVLLYSADDRAEVQDAQRRFGTAESAAAVERAMAACARGLLDAGTGRLVVAGGETSGAVATALGIRRFRIGPAIAPGVPWTAARYRGRTVNLALKSGNFGAEDFFVTAWNAL